MAKLLVADFAVDRGVEEQLEVHLRLFTFATRHDDGVALQARLGVEHTVIHFLRREVAEGVATREVGDGTVEQHTALVDDDHVVEQTLDVVYLMGGDDERTVILHVVGHHLAEERFPFVPWTAP